MRKSWEKKKQNSVKNKEVELERTKGEIAKKILQHIIKIDQNFSKKTKIEEQLQLLEKRNKKVTEDTFIQVFIDKNK